MKVIAKITGAALAAGFVALALIRPSKVRSKAEPESTGSRNPDTADQAAHNTVAQQHNQTQDTYTAALNAREDDSKERMAATAALDAREDDYIERTAALDAHEDANKERTAATTALNAREGTRKNHEDTHAALLNNMRETINDVRASVPEASRESSREYLREPLLCIGNVDVNGAVSNSSGATFRVKERSSCHPERSEGSCTSGAEKDSSAVGLKMTGGGAEKDPSGSVHRMTGGGSVKDSSDSAIRMTEGGYAKDSSDTAFRMTEGGTANDPSSSARKALEDASTQGASQDAKHNASKQSSKSDKPGKRRFSRVALSFAVVAGLIMATTGASYAYLTLTTNTEKNIVSSKEIQISLIENNEEVTTPTRTISLGIDTKKIEVYNPPGAGDAVVRVTFSPQLISSDSSDDQTLYEFNETGVIAAPINNQSVMGSTTLYFASDWNNASNGWLYKDGYFYYNNILEAGSKTPPLLTGVTASLANANIEVVVSAEGLQAHPNEAIEVWGVSIS